MKTKPWPIVILAALYTLGPVFNTLAGAWVMKMSWWSYIHALLFQSSLLTAVCAIALYPLAGFAIFAVKEWSYPVYLAVMGATLYMNYDDWQNYSNLFTLPVFITTMFVNVGLVSYFLLPAVRMMYFDKRLRWWEIKPRYEVEIPATLVGESRQIKCWVLNISEGGAFVKSSTKFQLGFETSMSFTVFDQTVCVPVKVVHLQTTGIKGAGFQFRHTDETEEQVRKITDALRLFGTHIQNRSPEWREGLKSWAATLVRTGKGLVPEVSQAKGGNRKPGGRQKRAA